MKNKISLYQIFLTLAISYCITSYINAEFNPFNLGLGARLFQVTLTGFSLMVQYALKDFEK
jgi:hypothetical protein